MQIIFAFTFVNNKYFFQAIKNRKLANLNNKKRNFKKML